MKRMLHKILPLLLISCLGLLAGCGGSSAGKADAPETAAEDTVYEIGILQLVQHDALGQATQGFEDALTELLGADHVVFAVAEHGGTVLRCARF